MRRSESPYGSFYKQAGKVSQRMGSRLTNELCVATLQSGKDITKRKPEE